METRTSELGSLMVQLGLALMFGWKFFRGYLLFALARRGDIHMAIWLQCFPFFVDAATNPILSLHCPLLVAWSLRGFVGVHTVFLPTVPAPLVADGQCHCAGCADLWICVRLVLHK